MDDLVLRLAELESENEEQEKLIGKLSVQLRQTQELLRETGQSVADIRQQQHAMLAEQKQICNSMRSMQRHLDTLTARTDQLDETADLVEDHYASLYQTVSVLSRDMDHLYEDMNVLASETRSRGVKLKAEIERFLWDQTAADGDDEEDE